jgi:cytochrome c-type biogenesis protein CcmF
VKSELGLLAVLVGCSSALIGVVALSVGIRTGNPALTRVGRRSAFMVLAAGIAAAGVMEWALLSHDFSLQYVYDHHARATPTLYTVASLWGALEGSIILWALILGGYLAWSAHRFRHRIDDPLVGWALVTQMVVALFFFCLLVGPANPFKEYAGAIVPRDGLGPNPLLQNHVLMAVHPPMLYLGYVGFTVPFSFAISALATGRLGEGWLVATRRATLVAWGFLSLGIVLGSWWSYETLGWGGYWGWDPVENASLLPWLTATAYLHSVMVQERRGMLRVWNLSLVVATFCLTILGTFLTRSGIIGSVHAFNRSGVGPALLGFLAVIVVAVLVLIGWRGDRLRSPGRVDSPVSREGAFLVNNLLFAAFAFVVLLGTVFPLVAEALDGGQRSVGEPYFERMTRPIGLCLLFLMAVAPALPWRTAGRGVLGDRLLRPAIVGTVAMVVAVLAGAHGFGTVATFGLGAFALAAIVRQVHVGVRARRRAEGGGRWRAFGRTFAANPRLYGGLVVHSGIVIIAVAFAVSQTYAQERQFRLQPGETSAEFEGYTFTYLGPRTTTTPQRTQVATDVRIERDGESLGVYAPNVRSYPAMALGTPSVRAGLIEDVYLKLVKTPDAAGRITLTVFVNPLVIWLWIGGIVVALGTLVALMPSLHVRRGRPGRLPPPPSRDDDHSVGDEVIADDLVSVARAGSRMAQHPGGVSATSRRDGVDVAVAGGGA